jgi:hypothetical protein
MDEKLQNSSEDQSDSFKEEKMDCWKDLEEIKLPVHKDAVERVERKKYLRKSGKSLWMKRKAMKTKALSIKISSTSTADSSAHSKYI